MGRLYDAYVEVGPRFTGMGDIKRAGDKAGKEYGKALTDAAEKAAKANVRKLGETLAKARAGEADAAGKVRVAEAKLNEVRSNSKAKASQLAAAEESLASAQRKAASASDTAADAAKALDKARDRVSKTADTAGAQSGNRFSRAFKGRLSKMGGDREGKQFASRFGVGMNGAIGSIVSKSAGVFAAGFAGIAAGGFLKDAIGQASNLGETMSKSAAVFGSSNKIIQQFAATSAKSLGQSKTEAVAAAAQFGNMFNQLGIGQKPAAQMSLQMVTLASDFASFHNADITEVLEAQNAAFRGEYDAVQKFVPTINAAAVEQEGLRLKLAGSTKELSAQDKAIATQSLLLRGAGKATGDFARTSGGLANQQRILKAQFADSKAELGQGLLPVATKFFTFLNTRGIPALKEVSGGFSAFGAAFKANDGDITSSGFPGFMERLGLTARVAFDYFKANVLPRLKEFGGYVKNTIIPIVKELVQDRLAKMGEMFGSIKAAIQDNRPELEKLGGSLKTLGAFLVETVLPAFEKMQNNVFPGVGKAAGFLINTVAGLVSAFNSTKSALSTSFDAVKSAISTTVGAVGRAIGTAFSAVSTAMSTAVGGVRTAWEAIKLAFSTSVTAVVGALRTTWATITSVVSGPLNAVVGVVQAVWSRISPILVLPFYIAKKVISETFTAIRLAFTTVVGWVTTAFSAAWAAVTGVLAGPINKARAAITTAWNAIKGAFNSAKDWVTGAFSTAWATVKNRIEAPLAVGKARVVYWWALIKAGFNSAKDWALGAFASAWASLKDKITSPISNAKNAITTILGTAKGGLRWVFNQAVTGIGTIWAKLQELAKKPIRFIINTVLNEGLIGGFNWIAGKFDAPKIPAIPIPKGFAAGGRIPGRPSAVDNTFGFHKGGAIPLATGEFIVNARQTARNLPLLRSINNGDEGFADGGLFGNLKKAVSSAYGAGKSFVGDVADFTKDPGSWLKQRFSGPLARLSELGKSQVAQIVSKVPHKIADTLVGKAKDLLKGLFGAGPGGPPGSRTSFRGVTLNQRTIAMLLNAERMLGRQFHITQGSYSTRVAASGSTHAGGGAMDTNGPGGWGAAVRALRAAGFAAWHRTPSQGPWNDHIHSIALGDSSASPAAKAQMASFRRGGNGLGGMAKGGQIGVYDRGGRWPTGTLGVNLSGKTETVIPGDGTVRLHPADIRAIADAVSGMSITLDGNRLETAMAKRSWGR